MQPQCRRTYGEIITTFSALKARQISRKRSYNTSAPYHGRAAATILRARDGLVGGGANDVDPATCHPRKMLDRDVRSPPESRTATSSGAHGPISHLPDPANAVSNFCRDPGCPGSAPRRQSNTRGRDGSWAGLVLQEHRSRERPPEGDRCGLRETLRPARAAPCSRRARAPRSSRGSPRSWRRTAPVVALGDRRPDRLDLVDEQRARARGRWKYGVARGARACERRVGVEQRAQRV